MDFQSFSKEGAALTRDTNRELASFEISGSLARVEKVAALRRVRDAAGLRFFSLGPLYVGLNLQFDIIANFQEAVGEQVTVVTSGFAHQVVQLPGRWGRILQALPVEQFDRLTRFMETQLIRDKAGAYWKVSWRDCQTTDPFGADRKDIRPYEDPARIRVFVPSGPDVRYAVIPVAKEPPIRIQPTRPDPDLVLIRQIGLDLKRDVSEAEARAFFDSRGTVLPFRLLP